MDTLVLPGASIPEYCPPAASWSGETIKWPLTKRFSGGEAGRKVLPLFGQQRSFTKCSGEERVAFVFNVWLVVLQLPYSAMRPLSRFSALYSTFRLRLSSSHPPILPTTPPTGAFMVEKALVDLRAGIRIRTKSRTTLSAPTLRPPIKAPRW